MPTKRVAALAVLAVTGCTLIGDGALSDKPAESSGASPPTSTVGAGASSSGGAGGAGGAACGIECPPEQTCCAGACADLTSDEVNCGACGVLCGAGEVCYGSACVSACPAGLNACGTDCVDLTMSAANCGVCGNDCLEGRSCAKSACTPPWVPMNEIGAPYPRQRAAAVWAGQALFVWGGHGAAGDLADGGLYSVESNAWEPVTMLGAPTARALAAAVWTGKMVIVWGGGPFGSQAGLRTGARFNPTAKNWIGPTSTTNAPAGRRHAAAFWTGARMLVWGGDANGSPVDGGGLYDPVADAWTPVSATGAPGGRLGFASVWSGSELLVFGGRPGGVGAVAEGYGYDPQANTWRALPPAPLTARYDAFATWQDGTFLVVGGSDASGAPLTDGAAYDPTTDAWTAIPAYSSIAPRSAPPSRSGWSAWTGLRTLIAGGVDGAGAVRLDGAAYEPNTASWAATIPDWPSAKQHEFGVGVWTGRELLLWSGLHDGVLVTNGERYLP